MLLLILILIIVAGAGGFGYSRYGAISLSPLGMIALILLILWLTGNLHIPANLRF
jgi:hypothetical protein